MSWWDSLDKAWLKSKEEAAQFVKTARAVAKEKGIETSCYICGFVGVRGFKYEDDLVQILADTESPALEIVFKYPDGTCHNPVIMVTDEDEVIRCHGEHCYVVPHIETLGKETGL